jgi:membrane-bound lytic murein transglycosylase A
LGSINVPLTAGRSIATDPLFFPKGALAFLETKKPRLDTQGQVLGWEPLQRWALNQDTGGAIKGPGRVDLFCGTGEAAEWTAGRMKHPGRLYFFLLKE